MAPSPHRSLTAYERSILEELSAGADTARSIAVNIGGGGWNVLRALTSLEALGLVQRFDVVGVDVVAWRLVERSGAAA